MSAARLTLKLGLVAALVYLGVVYYERWSRRPLERPQPKQATLPPDSYVYPPKSYVTDADSARKLIGKPLWVKEGYRWNYEPDNRALGPLEKIVPTGVRQGQDEVLLEFRKEGHIRSIPIGSKNRFYVDEIFFLKDPRELFDHWPQEIWKKIEEHQVEKGMTEFQIAFALGAGEVVRSSLGQATRVVEYTLCQAAGLPPVRVTYQNGVALRIEELSAGSGDQT